MIKHPLNINMKKSLLAVITTFITFSCSTMNDSVSFSKYLYKIQKKEKECSIYPKLSLKQRNEVVEKINFINYHSDTVYYLESFYFETGTTYSAIWTNNGKIEYKGDGKTVEIGDDFFIKRLYPMIEKWDTITIRSEEKKSINRIETGTIVGTRIILEREKVNMQCIKFFEFFDVEKDNR